MQTQTDVEIVRDGTTLRVPIFAMDGTQRAVAAGQSVTFVADNHRPGFRPVSAADQAKRAKLYQAADAALAERWKIAPPVLPQTLVASAEIRQPAAPVTSQAERDALYHKRDKALEQRWQGKAA